MLPKAIIFLSFLYIVRAGIITVNAYHDDNEISNISEDEVAVTYETRGFCVSWRCEQYCRSMGFAGGRCINSNTCQCHSRSASSKADISLQTSESDANELPEEPRNCNLWWCEQTCRRMGRPGGVCVNGRCKCDLLRSELLSEEHQFSGLEADANELPEEPRSCNLRWCEQACRRIGRPGGACVNGRCKCDLLRSDLLSEEHQFSVLESINENEQSPEARASCTTSRCNQICRRLGYGGGVCVRPNVCQCRRRSGKAANDDADTSDIFLVGTDLSSVPVLELSNEIKQSPEARASCTASRCNQICRRLGYGGGVCVRPNVCQCHRRSGKAASDDADATDIFLVGTDLSSVPLLELSNEIKQSPEARASCTASRCNQICRRLGYGGGVCVRPNVCQCHRRSGKAASDDADATDIFLVETELSSVPVLDINNINKDVLGQPEGQNSCVNSICNQICQKLGYARGVCISSSLCQCSGRRGQSSSDYLKSSETTDVAIVRTSRSCGAAECNNFCRKMGYVRGVCIGTYCQCRMQQRQSAVVSPSIDADFENEERENTVESNDIPEISQE